MRHSIGFFAGIFALACAVSQGAKKAPSDLFMTAHIFRAGSINTCVASADFNGDGFLDLAVGDQNAGVHILLGNGRGSFGAPVNHAAGTLPECLVAGDFNGDGKTDIAVADYGGRSVSILLGNGDGTFQPALRFPAGDGPYFITASDFNNDGKLDLAVTNEAGAADTIEVLLGNGDGTFRKPLSTQVGSVPSNIQVADLNRDGIMDAVVTNAGTSNDPGNTVTILLGIGDGTFRSAATITVGNQPYASAIADFDGDGRLDLAVANNYDSTVSILLGKGGGHFKPFRTYSTGAFPNSIVALRDGRAVNLAVGYNAGVAVMPGHRDGTFDQPRLYSPAGASIITADFNGDGKADLAAISIHGVAIYLGGSSGEFRAERLYSVARSGVPVGLGPDKVVSADFNGDGIPDLAVAEFDTFALTDPFVDVFLGSGQGLFHPHRLVTIGPAANVWGIAAGDINGDGKPDLVVGCEQTGGQGSLRVLLGNGDGTFGPPIDTLAGQQNASIAIADFNRDGIADLAVVDQYTHSILILIGKGDGTFEPPVKYAENLVEWVATADLNHDGNLDLIASGWSLGGLSVLLGNGDGTFKPPAVYLTPTYPSSPALGDFDGDGNIDVALSDGLQTLVFPGNGDGTFRIPIITNGNGGNFPVVADFNGDGKLDLAGTDESGVLVSLGHGDGTFARATSFITGQNNGSGLVAGDFNGDGAPDLATTNYWDDNVAVLLRAAD